MKILTKFVRGRITYPVEYNASVVISPGVSRDHYSFKGHSPEDLSILRINPGCKTPWWRVLQGNFTFMGIHSGHGSLAFIPHNGEKQILVPGANAPSKLAINVNIGEIVQWTAAKNSQLSIYLLCAPVYIDGRFQVLTDLDVEQFVDLRAELLR